jgi:hypothetical protein
MPLLMTVVETRAFLRDSASTLTEEERVALINYLAANPEAGDLMAETGGIRKLRWGVSGRGKRGGVRVISNFHAESIPLFLLNVFAKNEKANLTKAERNELRSLVGILVEGYRGRRLR